MQRLWISISGPTALLTALIFAMAATTALAHEGHFHDDGRIMGQPDFKRIGTQEFEFHPKAHAYTHKRAPNGAPLWFHVDDFAASSPFAPGALNDLPPSTEPVVCATSGHRIKVAYAETYLKWKSQDPYMTVQDREAIRNAVLRMNWKVKNESMLSSDGETALRMRVDCDGLGQINVSEFVVSSYPYNQPSSVWTRADEVLGAPEGANSIKHLIFFDGPGPVVDQYGATASGFGEVFADSKKSSSDASGGNNNRYYTASTVIYNPGGVSDPLGYWDSHVTLHELFHTMGAVQPNAPFATSAKHCTDGIDVMCYNDGSPQGSGYTESRCPLPGYATPIGTPLDCEYDTYFDAGEENQEWLNTNWNVGGAENPFLVQTSSSLGKFYLRNSNSAGPADITFSYGLPGDRPISGDWNGDGRDTIGVYRPSYRAFHLRNANSAGVPDYRFTYGLKVGVPVVGDWDGDGDETVGLYDGNGNWYLNQANDGSAAELEFNFGANAGGDVPVTGDWNGDGKTTIGVYRPSNKMFYLRNSNSAGPSDYEFPYGILVGTPVVADWNGDGGETIGLWNPETGWWNPNEQNDGSGSDAEFIFGAKGDVPITGDWNADKVGTVGVFRP